MPLQLPEGVHLAPRSSRFSWPEAEEDKLFECASVWRDFAEAVAEVIAVAFDAAALAVIAAEIAVIVQLVITAAEPIAAQASAPSLWASPNSARPAPPRRRA
ncbi:hypothetical protein [Streptomyces sioyaensis]|uniref:hypothetical protein n=1 Tax=Streptomyces sioyaensis TaxID=67364 RepID=UPI0037AF13B3